MARTGFKDSEVYLLHEITTRLDRIARQRILGPAGITYPEFLLLMAARELPSPTQDDVGAFLDMSKSLVSQRVSSLLKKGLVNQAGDPENRRRVKLCLTREGQERVTRIYRAMVNATTELFDALRDFRPAFRRSLSLLAEGLAREEGQVRPW